MLAEARDISPTQRFLQEGFPLVYSGTGDKIRLAQKHLTRFIADARVKTWGEVVRSYLPPSLNVRQLAVPAAEPNEMIAQHNLMVGKALNQTHSLRVALAPWSEVDKRECVIPSELYQVFYLGQLITFLSSDVGVREFSDSNKVWEPRRNFYLRREDRYSKRIEADQIRAQLLGFYAMLYGTVAAGGELVRAVDSAIALTDVQFMKQFDLEKRVGCENFPGGQVVYPANNTVGVVFERNPLGDARLRNGYLDYEIAKATAKARAHGHHDPEAIDVLRGFHGVAGAARAEVLYDYAQKVGIHAEILSDAKNKREDLYVNAKGFSYVLLQSLLLTLAQQDPATLFRRATEGFLVQIYPKGGKEILRVH